MNGAPEGLWVSPTLFDKLTPEMSIYANKIFGPVLLKRDAYPRFADGGRSVVE